MAANFTGLDLATRREIQRRVKKAIGSKEALDAHVGKARIHKELQQTYANYVQHIVKHVDSNVVLSPSKPEFASFLVNDPVIGLLRRKVLNEVHDLEKDPNNADLMAKLQADGALLVDKPRNLKVNDNALTFSENKSPLIWMPTDEDDENREFSYTLLSRWS